MRLRDHYDWIVLGDHPGALLSAALVARLGLSVLVLPLSKSKSVVFSPDQKLLVDFENCFILGMEPGGLLRDCLEYLGASSRDFAWSEPGSARLQVVTPRHRVVFGPDQERLQLELERELGQAGAIRLGWAEALKGSDSEIHSFWSHLPERLTAKAHPKGGLKFGPSEKFSGKSTLTLGRLGRELVRQAGRGGLSVQGRNWFSSDSSLSKTLASATGGDVLDLARGFWAGVTQGNAPSDAKAFSFLHLLSVGRSGVGYRGGMRAYREALSRLAKSCGADVPDKSDKIECRRIFVQNGRFAGVLPSHGGSMIGATGGILGCPVSEAEPFVTYSGRSWHKKLRKATRPTGWRFTLALALGKDALPPGMSSRVIWQEADAPAIEMEVVQPGDYGLQQSQRTPDVPDQILFLRTVMPWTTESLQPQYQRMVSARLLRQLTEVCPFIEYYISGIFPDFRLPQEDALSSLYGFTDLESIPASLRSYSSRPSEDAGDQTGVEGLFLASEESFPAWGSLGGTVAAIEGAAWIAHRTGQAGPIRVKFEADSTAAESPPAP